MVEHGGLGRPSGTGVVVDGHRMEKLGSHLGLQRGRSFLDQAKAEMDMAK